MIGGQIDVESVSTTVSRSRVQRMSGNRTSRRPWDTKPVVAASTWASCRPRVCSGICMSGTWTEPASGGSSSAPGLDNPLIASTTTVIGTRPNVAAPRRPAQVLLPAGRVAPSIEFLHTTPSRSGPLADRPSSTGTAVIAISLTSIGESIARSIDSRTRTRFCAAARALTSPDQRVLLRNAKEKSSVLSG